MAIDTAGLTDSGKVRPSNEDSHWLDAEAGLFVIADGMGGHLAGEVASRLAVETIQQHCVNAEERTEAEIDGERYLAGLIYAAHQAIQRAAKHNPSWSRMGCTVVIAWIPGTPQTLWVGHVGDSRAYLLRGEDLRRLTDDHTLFNQARLSGSLPADPEDWPPRHALSQALGSSMFISPQINRYPIASGDRVILCSDGLTDMLADDEIEQIVLSAPDLQSACANLIAEANRYGGQDNITVVITQIDPPGCEGIQTRIIP